MASVDELEKKMAALDPGDRSKMEKAALAETSDMAWVPNPGPQTMAYFSPADELLYGGEVGGGKSDLICGLALTAHTNSLIMRRFTDDARLLMKRAQKIVGHSNGLNKTLMEWNLDDKKLLEFGGAKNEDDKQRYKGRAHDLKAFDELADFTLTQYLFITTWLRTVDPNQRVRIVAGSNPPTTAEGIWILVRWAAWLDPKHPNPAEDGELRWYVKDPADDTKEIEVAERGPHYGPYYDREGKEVLIEARSRTFIRSRMEDNPDYERTGYSAVLDGLGGELKQAYRQGDFEIGLNDQPQQLIPSSWVREAQARWTERPPPGLTMTAMGVDPAAGGTDSTCIANRYDAWFGKLEVKPGKETPLGSQVAGLVLVNRRDGAVVVIDMGGGYGGGPLEHLEANGIPVVGYNGANKSSRKTEDRRLNFYNKRAEAYWKFRAWLDPSQPGGSPVALPPDNLLLGDLTAPTFRVLPKGILIEAKDDIKKRIGRSTDRGDAIVMCASEGAKGILVGKSSNIGNGGEHGLSNQRPRVILGRAVRRRQRR